MLKDNIIKTLISDVPGTVPDEVDVCHAYAK